MLDQGVSLEEIGKRFGLHESTVSYWVKKHGLEAAFRNKHAAKGGLRQDDLEQMIEAGRTIAELAQATQRSKATVRYWMRRYGLRTVNTRGRRASKQVRYAKEAGRVELTMICPKHGETQFVIDGRGGPVGEADRNQRQGRSALARYAKSGGTEVRAALL
jgi:transposase